MRYRIESDFRLESDGLPAKAFTQHYKDLFVCCSDGN